MNRLLFSLLTFLTLPAHAADPGLAQLRESFAPIARTADTFFQRAAAMRPLEGLGLGEPITKEKCAQIQDLVRRNYPVDPFHFAYEGGGADSGFCGGRWGYQQNHLLSRAGVSGGGRPFALVVQLALAENPSWRDEVLNYFLDAQYHVVEVQFLSYSRETKRLVSYGITSLDAADNLLTSVWDQSYSVSGGGAQDVSGEHRMQRVVLADGSNPHSWIRNTIRNAKEPAKDYQLLHFSRADKSDWQSHLNLITFDEGYYVYDGKYYSSFRKPDQYSGLTVKYRGGKEYCAAGSVTRGESRQLFPAAQKDYYDCMNY